MPLSIVVCTYNNAAALAETLRAIAAQEGCPPAAAGFEVLVVDNNCTDDTASVVAAAAAREDGLANLRRVVEPAQGQVYARVRGVRESRGEWVAFVDDDNLLDPGWVREALGFIAAHPRCGAFGGQVEICWEETPPPEVARRDYAYAATALGPATRRLEGRERWRLRGAGLVCRKQPLTDSGWLDWQACVGRVGRGTVGGDDTEIVMRLARQGEELWHHPGCRLRHVIHRRRLTIPYLRSLHHGFALADPLLLGLERPRGSLSGWAARYALSLARRSYWWVRHTVRGWRDPDARLTAQLSLDTLRGNLRGLAAVARLGPARRKLWLGQTTPTPPVGPRPLRVLHLHRGLFYGGLERMLFCLAADRAACPGMEPVFGLGHRERLARELAGVGAPVEIIGSPSLRRPWRSVGALRRFRALVRRERFDALVCHGSAALAFYGAAARGLGAPVVLWMHSDTKVRNKNPVEWLAGRLRPALVICNSAYTAASLPRLFPAPPPPPPHVVIPCPVPRPPPAGPGTRAARRAEFSTPADAVVVILPSRLEEWKGHGVLLEALGRLRELPGWVCWIVGGACDPTQQRFLQTLKARAEAMGIASRMRFTGERADVPELLDAADIFCQPNLTPEPFGVNVIEALLAGLPVVGSDSGGTREIVDLTCGRLLPPGDVPALAAELARLIRDPAARRALGSRAAARAELVSSPDRLLPVLRDELLRLTPAGAKNHRREETAALATALVGGVLS